MKKGRVKDFLYEELSYKIRGAIFRVYNELGFGHKEAVYKRALAKEFDKRGIPYKTEKQLDVRYGGEKVGVYQPDFIVDGKVLIEAKAVPHIPQDFERQLTNYLKGTGFKLGFFVNFGAQKLDIRRRVWTPEYQRKSAKNQR